MPSASTYASRTIAVQPLPFRHRTPAQMKYADEVRFDRIDVRGRRGNFGGTGTLSRTAGKRDGLTAQLDRVVVAILNAQAHEVRF